MKNSNLMDIILATVVVGIAPSFIGFIVYKDRKIINAPVIEYVVKKDDCLIKFAKGEGISDGFKFRRYIKHTRALNFDIKNGRYLINPENDHIYEGDILKLIDVNRDGYVGK